MPAARRRGSRNATSYSMARTSSSSSFSPSFAPSAMNVSLRLNPVLAVGAIVLLCCATTYYYTLRSAERACHALGHSNGACFDAPPRTDDPFSQRTADSRVGIPTRGTNTLRDAYAYASEQAIREQRDKRETPPSTGPPTTTMAGLPVNIRTSGTYNAEYTQVGFLSNGKEDILALHGRMIMPNRNKWQYYTASDKFHSVRLPITVGGKNASSEYGCDEVSNGDSVYVEGYNMPFRVTLYEKQGLQYIPYL